MRVGYACIMDHARRLLELQSLYASEVHNHDKWADEFTDDASHKAHEAELARIASEYGETLRAFLAA